MEICRETTKTSFKIGLTPLKQIIQILLYSFILTPPKGSNGFSLEFQIFLDLQVHFPSLLQVGGANELLRFKL